MAGDQQLRQQQQQQSKKRQQKTRVGKDLSIQRKVPRPFDGESKGKWGRKRK
jgi:hypothetical protein